MRRTRRMHVAALLKEQLGLELSETKTLVTPVTKAFAFLGHHVVVRDNRALQADRVRDVDPEGAQPSVARADQATLPAQSHRSEPARSASRSELAATGMECLLPPCVGSQASLLLARLLRVVDRVSLAAEEASACASESVEGDVPTVEGARDAVGDSGTIVGSRCSSPAGLASDPTGWARPARRSSRSIMESRVHNERCMPGSEGGARKPAGESRQGAERPPYATTISSRHVWHRTRQKPWARMPQRRYAASSRST